jgi:proteic killer suppression protein
MIRSFKCKETEKIFNRYFSKKLPTSIQQLAYRKLLILNNAQSLESLNHPPGNKLEALKGKRKGQYSIRVNDQWRICFKWERGSVENVKIEDYHK